MNYYKAAEQVLSSVTDLKRSIENLERRKERLIKEGAPRGIGNFDYDKPFVDARRVNNTLEEALSVQQCAECIERTRSKLDEIKRIIEQLPDELRRLVLLWYVENRPRDQIMEELAIASPTTLYSKRNQAIGKFALLYYGAPALDSL